MIRALLQAIVRNRPCRRIDVKDQPYLLRYYLGQAFGRTWYLHRFLNADGDRHQHNHPWRASFALVLAGGYMEERLVTECPIRGLVTRRRRMFPGRVNRLGANSFHRIAWIKPDTWTLFAHKHYEVGRGWGFKEAVEDTNNRYVVVFQQTLPMSYGGWWHDAPLARDVHAEIIDQGHELAF